VRHLAVPLVFLGDDARREGETLVARLRAGDLGALGEAYDAHHVHVRAFATRLLGDSSAAEDLVQETFLTLPRAVARFRGESSLRTFLVSIAVRHAGHHIRAAARRRTAMARFARERHASEASERSEGGGASPDEEAERRRLAAELSKALDALPVEQRVAVVLCEVEERTSAEAARIVGAPEGTIRTRLFHAKRKLTILLDRQLLDREGRK
jgi:RNA polymerase sigma-70 factor (ECF subfamily)